MRDAGDPIELAVAMRVGELLGGSAPRSAATPSLSAALGWMFERWLVDERT